jgi:hypothetical protein
MSDNGRRPPNLTCCKGIWGSRGEIPRLPAVATNDISPVTARSVSDEAVSAAQLGIASSACGLLAMTRPGVILL